MSGYSLTEEQIAETMAAIDNCRDGSGRIDQTALASALKLARSSVQNRLRRLAERGLLGYDPVMPGFAISQVSSKIDEDGGSRGGWVKQRPERSPFEMPAGHTVKGVSALVDETGRVTAKWIKTKADDLDPASLFSVLADRFANFEPSAEPLAPADLEYEDQMALYPWNDVHLGVHIWGKEASRDWDLRTAEAVNKATFAKVVARTPPTKKAILLVGGDTLHADSNENRTAASGNSLQVDGRYPKVLLTACEISVWNVGQMLGNHQDIEIIVLPGNHDEHASHAIAFFLHAWFRHEPRVTVDLSPSLFRFREFGRNMHCYHHGHATKTKDMPSVMAARQAEMWGRTAYRYAHVFHVHHASKVLSEGGGVISETHQTLVPADAWHFGAGYTSGRSVQSIIYDRQFGEVSRSRVVAVE